MDGQKCDYLSRASQRARGVTKNAKINQTKLTSICLCCVSHSYKTAKKSKFCWKILSTEFSFYIYDWPLTVINVIASFCA